MSRSARAAALLLLAFAAPAGADVVGAGECDYAAGEYLNTVHESVWVPGYLANAARGDILLTAYGDDSNPVRALISALGQTYNHVLMVSDTGEASGMTRLTQETSIPVGTKMMTAQTPPNR